MIIKRSKYYWTDAMCIFNSCLIKIHSRKSFLPLYLSQVNVKIKYVFERIIFSNVKLPLSLAIRFMSVRGTLRVHIKPPPSDQLWFGFTSMPNIEWNFESFVGEHKFTGAPVILIGNRLKVNFYLTVVCILGNTSVMMLNYGFTVDRDHHESFFCRQQFVKL